MGLAYPKPGPKHSPNDLLQNSRNFTVNILRKLQRVHLLEYQAIPGSDQIASPTNQKTAGSKLERTGQLMFYGSWRHRESFSGGFLVRICLLGRLLRYLVKSLLFKVTP